MNKLKDIIPFNPNNGDILLHVLARLLHASNTGITTHENLKDLKEYLTDFPITLQVNGMLVTGKLITEASYLDALMADETPIEAGNMEQAVKNLLPIIAKVYRETVSEEQIEKSGYIHLYEARIFTASGTQFGDVIPLWRGRASSVDAVVFGEIEPKTLPPLT